MRPSSREHRRTPGGLARARLSFKAISPLGAAALLLVAGAGLAAGQTPVRIETGPGSVTVFWDAQPLLRYQSRPRPNKPYVESLYSPGGLNVLRDSPADHKHHHGLMFAVAVDGVDFWSETPTSGRQLDQGTSQSVRLAEAHRAPPQPPPAAIFTHRIAWASPQATALLEEIRTIEVTRLATGPATLVIWQSRLAPPPGRASCTLTGSPYFGLGMRLAASMDRGGQLFNAEGKSGQAQTNNARAAWTAYGAAVDGKPVTVAMFDLPGNPRPAIWFTMDQPFAYLSATLGLNVKPLVIESSRPAELRYAVAVWDGKVSREAIADLYQKVLTGRFPRK